MSWSVARAKELLELWRRMSMEVIFAVVFPVSPAQDAKTPFRTDQIANDVTSIPVEFRAFRKRLLGRLLKLSLDHL